MAFNATTGLGTPVKIAVPAKNVTLSLSGANGYTETYQIDPNLEDVAGNEIAAGTAFTLTAVAASLPGALTLSAAANASGGATVYTGTITGGGTNAFAGFEFTVAGFDTAANNGTFYCTASTTTTLTLTNAVGVSDTHAGTATATTGNAVYTGTITGGGSNAFAGDVFDVAGFVTNPTNNGSFIAVASSTTTLTLGNSAAIAETHAATATNQEATAITYVEYGSQNVVAGTATAVATVSADGLITATAPGGTQVEVSYPTFNNSIGDIVNSGNIMNGLPINKIHATINVTVVP